MKRTGLRLPILTTVALLAGLGTISAQGVGLEWAKKMGGSGYDYGNSIAVDAERNVYVTGYFNDEADFSLSSGKVTSKGGQDIFIMKQDAAGNVLWVKHFGGSGSDVGNGITLDTAGNIYVAGYFSDTVSFDPNNTAYDLVAKGFTDIFVCKLNKEGELIWAVSMGGNNGFNEGRDIALDLDGNVYTTGVYYNTVDFDPGTGIENLTAVASSDIFVSKLDANGQYVWARSMGGNRLDQGEKIAVDRWGYVYTTGQFQRQADFDPGPNPYNLTSGGNTYDVFVSKLDNNGDFVWAKQITGPNPSMGTGLALDYDANVYLTGNFSGNNMDFDPGPGTELLNSAGSTDIFVAKLDSAGSYLWAKSIGGSSAWGDRGYAIATDLKGNAFFTGYFSGTVDFNPGSEEFELITTGGSDIFIAKLDSSGNFAWAKQLAGSTSQDWGIGITVDSSGNVYSTGLFNNTVDFDPGSGNVDLTAEGGSDIYVHKLICTDTSSSLLEALVCTEYLFFDSLYTEAGTYTHILQNSTGCDSTITLMLEIRDAEAYITVDGFKLGTTEQYESYQWFLNGVLIPGATDSTYTVSENGDYTVAIVNDRGCIDTSDVYTVTNVPEEVGINVPAWAEQIKIYPNPVQNILYINTPVSLHVTIYSLDGRRLIEQENSKYVDVQHLDAGLYLLQFSDKDGRVIRVDKFSKIAGM